jgi:hypothetical protein
MHGAIPPFPQYDFMAWCAVKSMGTTFTVNRIRSQIAAAAAFWSAVKMSQSS